MPDVQKYPVRFSNWLGPIGMSTGSVSGNEKIRQPDEPK
jgi:hypothetical protein